LTEAEIIKDLHHGISCNKNLGVVVVGKPLIVIGPITYAIKGRDLLTRYGISSTVERTPRSADFCGCGYSIYVPHHTDEAERILIQNGIKVSGRSERGGGS
jgi:hypothetical protein